MQRITPRFLVNVYFMQDLWYDDFGLLQERQQNVLGIDLVMAVALENLVGTGSSILGTLGKTIKSHMLLSLFLTPLYCITQLLVRWLTLSIPQQSLYRGNLDQLMTISSMNIPLIPLDKEFGGAFKYAVLPGDNSRRALDDHHFGTVFGIQGS